MLSEVKILSTLTVRRAIFEDVVEGFVTEVVEIEPTSNQNAASKNSADRTADISEYISVS